MNWEFFEFVILGVIGLGGFLFRLLFQRLDSNAKMLIELVKAQSATHEQIVSLFRSVDKLEKKVDKILLK